MKSIKSEIPKICLLATFFYVFLFSLAIFCGLSAFPLLWFMLAVYAFQILQIFTDTEYYFRESGDSPE